MSPCYTRANVIHESEARMILRHTPLSKLLILGHLNMASAAILNFSKVNVFEVLGEASKCDSLIDAVHRFYKQVDNSRNWKL